MRSIQMQSSTNGFHQARDTVLDTCSMVARYHRTVNNMSVSLTETSQKVFWDTVSTGIFSGRAHSCYLLLLKLRTLKLQRSAILRHRPHDIIRYPAGDVGLDFEGDLYFGSVEGGQVGDDFLHNATGIFG